METIILVAIIMIAIVACATLLVVKNYQQKREIKNLQRRIETKRRRLVYWRDKAEKLEFQQNAEKKIQERRRMRDMRRYWQNRAILAEEELKKLKEKQVQ